MPHTQAADIQALIDALGPSGSFYLHNPAQLGPRDDPDGAALAGHSVTITAMNDNKSLKLGGLPAGYTLRRGDMLHVDYGSSPTRRALHRIVEDATANGVGTTGFFEVRPYLKTGTTTGAAVTLIRPAAKMMLEPGSFDPGTEVRVHTAGMSFTAIEVR
jgi:hypothetical protein